MDHLKQYRKYENFNSKFIIAGYINLRTIKPKGKEKAYQDLCDVDTISLTTTQPTHCRYIRSILEGELNGIFLQTISSQSDIVAPMFRPTKNFTNWKLFSSLILGCFQLWNLFQNWYFDPLKYEHESWQTFIQSFWWRGIQI